MCNLCVGALASPGRPARSPQAIVKPEPLARSAGDINLSTRTHRYLIAARVLLAGALKRASFTRAAISEAFEACMD